MRDEEIEKIAAQFYDEKLFYHNFEHVNYVLSSASRILNSCKRENIEIDEAVVYYAILFHDAGFIEDHTAMGYQSKEAYSADIAGRELKAYGVSDNVIAKVRDAIMATHMNADCQTKEEIAVRAADLSGLADDYNVFKKNTVDLLKEGEMMSGNKMTWEEWKIKAAEVIELYLRQELYLTSDYYNVDGSSKFHINARKNIDRLMQDGSVDID